jgi:hypothetical protein
MGHAVCLHQQVVAGHIGHQDLEQLEAQAGAVDLGVWVGGCVCVGGGGRRGRRDGRGELGMSGCLVGWTQQRVEAESRRVESGCTQVTYNKVGPGQSTTKDAETSSPSAASGRPAPPLRPPCHRCCSAVAALWLFHTPVLHTPLPLVLPLLLTGNTSPWSLAATAQLNSLRAVMT